MYIYIYVYYVCTFICIHSCVCMYVCMYVYIYIHIHLDLGFRPLCQGALQVPESPFARHLLVSVLALILWVEALCTGNPELAAPRQQTWNPQTWNLYYHY